MTSVEHSAPLALALPAGHVEARSHLSETPMAKGQQQSKEVKKQKLTIKEKQEKKKAKQAKKSAGG